MSMLKFLKLSALILCVLYMTTTAQRGFPLSSVPQRLLDFEYAVRGRVVQEALALQSQLDAQNDDVSKRHDASSTEALPFDSLVWCNIGNPQALGQPPISFFRDVLALLESPSLISRVPENTFAPDVVERATTLLAKTKGTGPYTHSKGMPYVRARVAEFITRRDNGVKADPEAIFLTNGASPAIQATLAHLVATEADGILVPIPQYPLYSGAVVALGGTLVGYHLDESLGWGLDLDEMEQAVADAAERGVVTRALVVINPGNPTGQVLSETEMRQLIQFAYKHKIVLLADEVYQVNVYDPEEKPWASFKYALSTMPEEIASSVELFSFHSISKGVMGECGHRGGYMELVNIAPDVVDQMYKYRSISLCSNTVGQYLIELMTNPPLPGEPSYPQYLEETQGTFDSLKRRAVKLTTALNELPGITVRVSPGALYAFPRVALSEAAIKAAADKDMSADLFYSLELLKSTGIVIVPGAGFKMAHETGAPFHFRTTFLPSEDDIDAVVDRFSSFHKDFVQKYGLPSSTSQHEDL